jgi:hypothetical protein
MRYNTTGGGYNISGKKFPQLMGTRAQVWHNTAYKTAGGLTKNNLMQNKSGRIVSKAKHNTAKKEKRLIKHGYGTKKGKFGFVKLNGHSKTKRMRGGSPYGSNFSPSGIDGQGITDYGSSSVNVQLAAGQAGGRRRKSRRGGSPYGNNFSPSGIDGQGITDYGSSSVNVQLAAGQAGGKRRRGSKRRNGRKSRRGGTTSQMTDPDINSPLNRALNA